MRAFTSKTYFYKSDNGLSQVKKGVRIFLIISVVSIIIVLLITARKETLSSLKQIHPLFLFLALGTCLLRIYLECLRLQALSWAFGRGSTSRWLDFKSSAEFTVGGYFLSLTPFGAGGLPLQLYILMRNKFSFGESGALIGMRGITWLIAFALGMPILAEYRTIFAGTGIRILSKYLMFIYLLFLALLILVLIRTEHVKYRLSKLNKFFTHHGKGKLADWINKLCNEIDKFKFGLKNCCNYKLIVTIFIAGISLFVYTLIAPLIFRGLGIPAPILKTAVIQYILTFLLMFAPTPGGAGIAEGIGFALYRNICTKQELLGVYVILWRFFTYYVGVFIGGLIILRMLVERKEIKRIDGANLDPELDSGYAWQQK